MYWLPLSLVSVTRIFCVTGQRWSVWSWGEAVQKSGEGSATTGQERSVLLAAHPGRHKRFFFFFFLFPHWKICDDKIIHDATCQRSRRLCQWLFRMSTTWGALSRNQTKMAQRTPHTVMEMTPTSTLWVHLFTFIVRYDFNSTTLILLICIYILWNIWSIESKCAMTTKTMTHNKII